METTNVTVYVDPTCPFAWITQRWLGEVTALTGLGVTRELMSLSVVNEGRELDGWYRDYNDLAWRPARVAAALLASPDAGRWPDLYQAFGTRRHLEGVRDDTANLTTTLADLGLPADLLDAAADTSFDDDLRARTARAVEPLASDGGTPILHLPTEGGSRAFFGPVLTAVPRGDDAVRLWRAVELLAGAPAFSELKTGRSDDLRTD